MSLRARALTAALGLIAGACTIGPSARTFLPALGPAGAEMQIELENGSRIAGELLAVDDTSFVLLSDAQITVAPFDLVRWADVAQMGTQIAEGEPPARLQRERLARVARYPQGIAPELMRALLANYGQEQPRVIAP